MENIDIDINPEYTMMKKVNSGLSLSQEQIDILESYNINYMKYTKLGDLILEVTEVYDETGDDILDNLLDVLSERDYYENYKK